MNSCIITGLILSINKYYMTRKFKLLLTVILTTVCINASSQNSQVLYYMNLPQNHLLNPAFRPSNKVYIGLPAISGINLNINNNILNFKDIFTEGQPIDSIAILNEDFDVDRFLSEKSDYNFLRPEASVQVFGLGFSAGKDLYVFADYNIRVESNFLFPKDMFRMAFYEQESLAGNSYDLSTLKTGIMAYNEIGVGFSKNITDKFRIGLKGKMLLGIYSARINTSEFAASIEDDYSQKWNADLQMDISGPVTIEWDEENLPSDLIFDDGRFESAKGIVKEILNTGNKGFGVDFGAVYDITDRLSVSAAVTDLGFMNWKKDILNVKGVSQFEFTGENIQDVYEGSSDFDEIVTAYMDSLISSVTFTETNEPFSTKLSYGISAGVSYNLAKCFSLGVLSYTRFLDSRYHEALTLSANLNIRSLFSASLAYTATNYRRDNIGFGIAFRPGWFQIYAMADRIPLTWAKVLSDGSKNIPIPEIWSTAHLRLGMNLCFGNRAISRKLDKPMIEVQ